MPSPYFHIDIETYCDLELSDVGVYKYTEHPSFRILLIGYALDNKPVHVLDLKHGDTVDAIRDMIVEPVVTKVAHNANFEITCLRTLFRGIAPTQWECTMVAAMQQGFPGKLEMVARVMGLQEQKDKEGARLIRLFSKPSKAKQRSDDWGKFKAYCAQDVEVERAIHSRLKPMAEKELWLIDQKINDRGVLVDGKLVDNAIRLSTSAQAQTYQRLYEITGLEKITPATLKSYMSAAAGTTIDSLAKDQLPAIRERYPKLSNILNLYEQTSKTSVAKFDTMAACVGQDGRARGVTQFYGAGRTGRWSGRLIQLQNLPRTDMSDKAIETARRTVLDGDEETFMDFYGDQQLSVLSQLIRSALVPREGFSFVVADFSAIEARVLAWLAGEQWRLDVFKGSGKIYEASAEKMFDLPAGSVDKHSPYRQKGKIAELALGYGGSKGALVRMGALKMGLQEDELPGIVDLWRAANPNITYFWKSLDWAMAAAMSKQRADKLPFGMWIALHDHTLKVHLPSGRELSYINPVMQQKIGQWMPTVWYMGVNQMTHQMEEQELYGAKLTENIVQALARDCLAEVIVWADKAGYNPVFHVHDELVCECPKDRAVEMYDALIHRMQQSPSWALMLPLNADGFVSEYYKK